MSLSTLIEKGPNPEKGMQALVLRNYQDILTARQLLWGWTDIARELGIEGKGNSLRRSFVRVYAKVAKGTLKPGMANPRPKNVTPSSPAVQRTASPSSPLSRVGVVPAEPKPKPDEKTTFDFEAARIDKNR